MTYSEVSTYLPRDPAGGGGRWVLGAPGAALELRGLDIRDGAPAAPAPVGKGLSRREKEVADLLLENLSNKEIASRLHVSERTAKFHVSNLLAKYGVQRRADLILLFFQSEQRP